MAFRRRQPPVWPTRLNSALGKGKITGLVGGALHISAQNAVAFRSGGLIFLLLTEKRIALF